jgi:uncharacterized protein YlxW (UPF0749 family)
MAETTPPPTDPSGRPLPPQATMGLLNYLTATSLDEDYAAASERRAAGGTPERRKGTPGPIGWLVLAMFGLLLMTAAIQTARTETERQSSRESLVSQIEQGREELDDVRADADHLRTEVDDVRRVYLSTSAEGRALNAQLNRLGVSAGTVPVSGPGLEIVVDDGPGPGAKGVVYDKDLQILVNGLWDAGAEAVAINGHRLSNLSAIRQASESITVNFRSLSPPYTITAIGDPDQLPARFVETDGGTWWFNLKSLYGMRFDIAGKDSVQLPAVDVPRLRHTERLEGDR